MDALVNFCLGLLTPQHNTFQALDDNGTFCLGYYIFTFFFLKQAITLGRSLTRMMVEGFRAENQSVWLAQESFIYAPYVLCFTSAVLAWYREGKSFAKLCF